MGHSLVRLLVHSHCSLIRLLRTARFAGALHCTHLFACSLTSLTPKLVGMCVILSQNYLILNHSAISLAQPTQMLTSTSLSDCGRCVAYRYLRPRGRSAHISDARRWDSCSYKQVPRGYIRCDYLVVTYCIII